MVARSLGPRLQALFRQYPFVTLTGPRQAGKTTLCRSVFPKLKYINLEALDVRQRAMGDPRAFLKNLGHGGAILDEVQRAPDLLSYLQVYADGLGTNSLFVLTGSNHFQLLDSVDQSLAGRTALLSLLPFSLAELKALKSVKSIDEVLFEGFYPRVHKKKLSPLRAYGDYFATYVERDLRQISAVQNLQSFQRFMHLCAGRVGQVVNLSSLGDDAGVSHSTVRHWLNLLETSYIAFCLPAYYTNIRKQLIRQPKIYFYDVGLVSYLLGIESAAQINTHPLRGGLFENLVVLEALKHRFNQGLRSNLFFFRTRKGLECDLLYQMGSKFIAIEVKAASTIGPSHFKGLERVQKILPCVKHGLLVHAGEQPSFEYKDYKALGVQKLSNELELLSGRFKS